MTKVVDKQRNIHIYMSEKTKEEVRRRAEASEMTMSSWVKWLIKRELNGGMQ